MNASEAAKVLTAAALVDKRTIGEADARMWAEIIPPQIGPRLAVEAVKAYYRENREMVMPSDVIKYVGKSRDDLRKRGDLDDETFTGLPSAAHRIIYSRAFYEALSAGMSGEQANEAGRRMAEASSDSERREIAPPPRQPGRIQDYR